MDLVMKDSKVTKSKALENLGSLISSIEMALNGEWDIGVKTNESAEGFLIMLDELREVRRFVRSKKS